MTSRTTQILKALSTASTTPEKYDKIAPIVNWFRPQENSKFYPHIQAYLSNSIDLETAVAKISAPIDETVKKGEGEKQEKDNEKNVDEAAPWMDLWYSVIHSSKRLHYTDESAHGRLVELVKALKEHPSKPNGPGWGDLPGMSMAVREAYNDAPFDDYEPPDTNEGGQEKDMTTILTLEATAWANFNYHLSLLTASKISDFANPFAIWALRSALEDDFESKTAPIKFTAHVPAAAAWIRGSARDLYEREVDLTPKDRKFGNPAKGGALWGGVAGFGKERWRFWRERFGVVTNLEGVGERTREVAGDAVRRMEGMERGED